MGYYWHLLASAEDGWGKEFALGVLMTLKISFAAYIVAFIFGCLSVVANRSRYLPFRLLSLVYTTTVRSLPELLVVLLLYFAIANGIEHILMNWGVAAKGFQFSPFWAAVVALAFVSGSFMSEVLRAAFISIPKGQIEAALSIGMSKRKMFVRIIAPQTLRYAMPGMSNLWLAITKESAIISVLGSISELLYTGYRASAATKEYIFFYGLTGGLFLLITIISVVAFGLIETRLNRGHG